jgi:integrase
MSKNVEYQIYVTEWIQYHRNFIKESTYANYMNIIENHLIKDFNKTILEDFNQPLLQNYTLKKINNGSVAGKSLAIKTVKDIMVVLKLSLRHAFAKEYITSFDLNVKYPSNTSNSKPKSISTDELKKIIQYVQTSDDSRDVGILIALFTGMRIGEICALKYTDISYENSTISVSRTLQRIYTKKIKTKIIESGPKTTSSYRSIPLSTELIKLLTHTNGKNSEAYVLSNSTKPVEPRILRKRFVKALEILDIQHYNFHVLRHTFATKCVEAQIDPKTLSVILGHSNVNTTLNLYVHPSDTQKQKAIDKISTYLTQ